MALPGELLGFNEVTCPDCKEHLELEVCRSGAGHYLGYMCNNCGPISRETGYYGDWATAEKELETAKAGGTPLHARRL